MVELERTTLWEVLAELVGSGTVTGTSTLPLAGRLAERLERSCWTVRIVENEGLGPALLAWAGPPVPGGLILSGHMDVVPWEGQPGWTREPERLTREGERLYGRGVADMKGALAQYVALAGELDPAVLSRPLVLVLTSDEEVGCLGAAATGRRLEELLGVPVPRQALIGEPTGDRAFRAHKGHVTVQLTAHGRGGHSSRPDRGASAIEAMAAVGVEVGAFAREVASRTGEEARRLFPEYPAVPFNLGTIAGGTASNMIPERCTLVLGFRPGPDATAEELLAELLPRLHRAAEAAAPGVELTVDETIIARAMTSPAAGPLHDLLRDLTGAELLGAPYATDGGALEAAGIASYLWGPGELEQAHQGDESLSVAALLESYDALREIVLRLCAEPG